MNPIFETCTDPCRSEPARDSGLSDGFASTDTPLSRAGSLLQWIFGVHRIGQKAFI